MVSIFRLFDTSGAEVIFLDTSGVDILNCCHFWRQRFEVLTLVVSDFENFNTFGIEIY